ncbi:peptide-methionine (S)-S-oxide reductase MsrA [Paucibacter sp. APW11]|uniref:Peptide methionine sulfoxide reductase MsrA n=1 Tax=Roseateles aquae TaxID=3077235 RepID=A0ABU3P886_9BURK|nr:peptide-methionine (S)-S-oxide reductase MsrA [Paucibacter sp. APW11]MDT8998713.1 peptide-methionine (S)-S-oxide reductase MsrA [Paucibacter sp. APW11]
MTDTVRPAAGEDIITLAGGCFWCLEAVYERVRGVLAVESGYSNGLVATPPSYEAVCSGQTGYAEVVQLRFVPEQVSLRALLEIFFTIHDPTTLNRQGADVGTQYRSAIFYHDEAQRREAAAVIEELQAALGGRVVTELQQVRDYHPAEAYHQHYFARNPEQGYCQFVVAAKVDKFVRTLGQYLRPEA